MGTPRRLSQGERVRGGGGDPFEKSKYRNVATRDLLLNSIAPHYALARGLARGMAA